MYITIIETATNAIVKNMWCPQEFISDQLKDGQEYIEGKYPKNKYVYDGTSMAVRSDYVEPKKLVTDFSKQEFIAKILESLVDAGYYLPIHNMQIQSKTQAKNAIDLAAGKARARIVSVGHLIDQEYALAEKEINEWRASGSPTNDIPPTLQTWVDATGMTPSDAADDTLAVANQYVLALRTIRHLRLTGKAAVDASSDFVTTAQSFINQLDAL